MVEEHPVAVGHAHAGHGGDAEHDHGLLHHHFDDLEQQRECNALGMWLFLSTEIMMFGGLFFAYSLYRHAYGGAFHLGSELLNHGWGTINTFVLLFSSLTMAMAVHSATLRDRRKLVLFLIATLILGGAFLGIKAIEWTKDYQEGLVPALNWTFFNGGNHEAAELLEKFHTLPQQVMMYFVLYFCMTGLHAIHMIVGAGLLLVFLAKSYKGEFTNGNDQPVEIMGLYWHFVDIVWVFLFPLLYLIAGLHLDKPLF